MLTNKNKWLKTILGFLQPCKSAILRVIFINSAILLLQRKVIEECYDILYDQKINYHTTTFMETPNDMKIKKIGWKTR